MADLDVINYLDCTKPIDKEIAVERRDGACWDYGRVGKEGWLPFDPNDWTKYPYSGRYFVAMVPSPTNFIGGLGPREFVYVSEVIKRGWRCWHTLEHFVLSEPVLWSMLPDGVKPWHYERWLHTIDTVRPDDPVYEPAGTDLRLTPGPRRLLKDLAAGRRRVFERRKRWASSYVTDGAELGDHKSAARITDRPLNPLWKAAFIAYSEPFPPNPLFEWHVRELVVTDAGRAWLDANCSKLETSPSKKVSKP